MSNIILKAETRTTKGNSPARALRREGRVPAILYGPNAEPCMLSVAAHDIEDIIKKGGLGRAILNLELDDGKEKRTAMVKELQSHPVTSTILHIDFYEVSMDRKIRVNVPIVTTGKSKGVEHGGMLQLIRRELEVLCLPNQIPQEITIDITDLDIGDSFHVEDIQIEEGVEIPHDVNFTVLTILSPVRAEEVEKAEEEEAEEEAEEAEEAATEEE